MNELMINTNELPIFQNKTLNAATKKIAGISLKIKKNLFEVALILSKIDETKAYEEDGFKSAAEYAQKTFGFKKSAAYSLLKIGKEYTAPTLESNLPHEPNNDFSTTQIEKVLPLKSRETVVELVEAGEITPDMSCKEIEAVVKSKTKKDEPEAEETSEPGTEETDSEPIEATGEIVETLYAVYIKDSKGIVKGNDMNMKQVEDHINASSPGCTAKIESKIDIKIFAEYSDMVLLYILSPIQ